MWHLSVTVKHAKTQYSVLQFLYKWNRILLTNLSVTLAPSDKASGKSLYSITNNLSSIKNPCEFSNARKATTDTKLSMTRCYSLSEPGTDATEVKSFELSENTDSSKTSYIVWLFSGLVYTAFDLKACSPKKTLLSCWAEEEDKKAVLLTQEGLSCPRDRVTAEEEMFHRAATSRNFFRWHRQQGRHIV